MSRRRDAAGTPAIRALLDADVPHEVRAYEHDPRTTSYGLEAAEALGVTTDRVLKTLLAQTDDGLVVAVIPVDCQLDLKAVAAACHSKRATMADPAAAERSSGYVVGGISPLGQRRALLTLVEESALTHTTVLVSAGRRGLDVELSPTDLVALTRASVVAIAHQKR
ncbi:Cys-tRNA(Pro) deacylase [Luteipulveratus mongoliensis]|uniref:Cys-tRNA(Pro)/Cys-tRNA(Cys) deacylase n=1 Tax=Luteipulveratus mongoliensis TaxID=571913 RepID=A0A0K1JJU8_9MICO|nr:Cys-tRNA(Pro) deacylase [Luteipulveratus mongoliensis]AKU16981.1 hypothetical protein VV02_15820 [Luteipulveratus mongoliensis]